MTEKKDVTSFGYSRLSEEQIKGSKKILGQDGKLRTLAQHRLWLEEQKKAKKKPTPTPTEDDDLEYEDDE